MIDININIQIINTKPGIICTRGGWLELRDLKIIIINNPNILMGNSKGGDDKHSIKPHFPGSFY